MKYVYAFKEGNKEMKNILGGKGANLSEMINLGLPVPDGFTVSTEACNHYYKSDKKLDEEIIEQIKEAVIDLERRTGKKLKDVNNPLLLSVRSGSRASMPGMMDTVLNLGLNDEVAEKLAIKTNNPRFVYDSYRRFIQMFADVVKGVSKSYFERYLDDYKEKKGVHLDLDLDAEDMKKITHMFKEIYKKETNEEFPSEPIEQLLESTKAVFRSWENERAVIYRKMHDIPSSWGTAVNIQEMVYGNLGITSGTGVAFTRNPSTGEKKLYGEYLINAQGEDVVAGIRTPEDINHLKEQMPEIYDEFVRLATKLENHYKDMQDMEFTIEDGKLYMLQTRNGKRTASSALKIALDLYKENMITKEEAIMRVNPSQLDQLLHPTFDFEDLKTKKEIAKGLAASPGAAYGQIYFESEDVVRAKEAGIKSILVRLETSPEDIKGMKDSEGVLTIRGGMTSHAAVVARGMGRCCVVGCSSLTIDEHNKTLTTEDGKVYKEGDYLSIDGNTGKVYGEKINTIEPTLSEDFAEFMKYADEIRKLGVLVNADTPKDAKTAIEFGAEGIGLCRTEHMFFEKDRIFSIRKMIMATTKEQRQEALDELLPYQRGDFEALFSIMEGKSVTIRYLDPPLHEFLPHEKEDIEKLASALKMDDVSVERRIESLKEFNPMMGHRGCRLAVTYPELAIMQTKAIIEAAIEVSKKGKIVKPELMIPLVGDINELTFLKSIIKEEADKLIKENNINLDYKIGTMIEVPRAVLVADEIAKHADFFSFGTNDLTQMTYGFSRDDAGKFLEDYYAKGIFEQDPFVRLDQDGVGALMIIAKEKGLSTNENLKLGICGEHGGEPTSVEFCHNIGLSYVSCSPYRVPIAKLAAAQAQIKQKR